MRVAAWVYKYGDARQSSFLGLFELELRVRVVGAIGVELELRVRERKGLLE